MMYDVLESNVFKIVMRVYSFINDMVCISYSLLAYSRRCYHTQHG